MYSLTWCPRCKRKHPEVNLSCLFASRQNPLPAHGTHKRWERGCECDDCREAMWSWIWDSTVPDPPRFTLSYLIDLPRAGNEVYLTPRMLSFHTNICLPTARRRIDELVRIGVLSQVSTEGHGGRSGTYRFHFDKLHPVTERLRLREMSRMRLGSGGKRVCRPLKPQQ